VTASIAHALIAAADRVWPVGGGESASDTLKDLAAQGYEIQINGITQLAGVTSYPTGQVSRLSECWVDAIHNPGGRPAKTLTHQLFV